MGGGRTDWGSRFGFFSIKEKEEEAEKERLQWLSERDKGGHSGIKECSWDERSKERSKVKCTHEKSR